MADEAQVESSSTGNGLLDSLSEQEREDWLMNGTATPKDDADPAPAKTEGSEAAKPEPIAPAADTGDQQEPKGRAGQRIQELLGERAALRARVAALEKPADKPGESATPKPAAAADGEPQPPDPTKWTGTWEELEAAKIAYLRDLTRWELGKADREKAAAKKAEPTEVQKAYAERAKAALTADPEYADAEDIIGRFATAKGVDGLLLESEVGPEIVMHLYKLSKDEQTRVANLGPVALAREIMRIELQLSKPAAAETPAEGAPKTRRTSAAAKPATELNGGKAATTVDEAETALADGNMGRYMEIMNARDAKR